MVKTTFSLVALLLLTAVPLAAQDIPAPKLKPSPTTDAHRDVIREGVALHEQGDYDGAIRKYQQVLSETPDDAGALYELGFALFAKGDYSKSLEVAMKGAQYESSMLAGFYTLIGNDFDQLKQPDKAIKAYQAGIKRFPDDSQLRFNLAITYISLNKSEDAKKSLKEAVRLDPNHPSSHLGLSQLYEAGGYKIPALLAFARFLVLEPNSRRSLAALRHFRQLMQSGVSVGSDKQINITLDTSEKKDEGDFSSIGLAMSLLGASRHLEENKNKTDMQLTAEWLDSFFAILAESKEEKKTSGFAWNYYRPYFVEMKRQNLVEPFCYLIHRSSNVPEVQRWLSQNNERVTQFLAWSKNYAWPKGQ